MLVPLLGAFPVLWMGNHHLTADLWFFNTLECSRKPHNRFVRKRKGPSPTFLTHKNWIPHEDFLDTAKRWGPFIIPVNSWQSRHKTNDYALEYSEPCTTAAVGWGEVGEAEGWGNVRGVEGLSALPSLTCNSKAPNYMKSQSFSQFIWWQNLARNSMRPLVIFIPLSANARAFQWRRSIHVFDCWVLPQVLSGMLYNIKSKKGQTEL